MSFVQVLAHAHHCETLSLRERSFCVRHTNDMLVRTTGPAARMATKDSALRYSKNVTVSRKLDLSTAEPKVDTGRTRRHNPGGGKITVPMGRMPRRNQEKKQQTTCV